MMPTQTYHRAGLNLVLALLSVNTSIAIIAFFISPLQAQESLRITAVVNEEMISVYDLKARIAMVAAFSGFDNSPETQQRLAPQILQQLVNERIQLQEAQRLKLKARDVEINNEKSVLETQIKIKPGNLIKALKSNGINPETVLQQFEAKIVWSKLVHKKFGRTIQISDGEVNEVIDEIKRNKGKPEYLISEILLLTDSDQKLEESGKLATRLVQQILGGANFSAISRNFSQSSSAQKGGNLGWNRIGQLGVDLAPVIQNLKPGQISNPIQTLDGIYIIKLNAQRASVGLEGPPAGPATVSLRQLHLAIPAQSTLAQINQIKLQSRTLTQNATGCNAFSTILKESGSNLSGDIGTFSIKQISAEMKILIKDLPVGKPSLPSVSKDGVVVLMVCNRQTPTSVALDLKKIRNRIKSNLTSRQLNLAARRYLRDLRRASFIEIRL
jgi:peptidyl-prolyl cis-trans isomerase SurA